MIKSSFTDMFNAWFNVHFGEVDSRFSIPSTRTTDSIARTWQVRTSSTDSVTSPPLLVR